MIGTLMRASLAIVVLLTAGCEYTGKLDRNFYTPATHTELADQKIPLSAAVVYGPELQGMRFHAANGGHSVDIPVGEPLKDAILAELAGIFEKTGTVLSLKDTSYDLYVAPKIKWTEVYANRRNGRMLFTARFEASLRSRDSKVELTTFSDKQIIHYDPPAEAFGAQVLTGASLGLLAPVTVPATTQAVGAKAKDVIGRTISEFVRDFGAALVNQEGLYKYAEMRKDLAGATKMATAAPPPVSYQRPKSRYDDFLDGVVKIQTPKSSGSGFFVTGDGLIVTNRHVVGREKSVSVRMRNGSVSIGKVVARNATYDLALVQISARNLTHLRLSRGGQAGIGNDVLAIGAPVGYDWSVARGIVSALRLEDGIRVIQTDTAINHGNSGGPLIDLSTGIVIGVNTYGISKKVAEGLNFAVASEEVLATFPKHMPR
jgi:S1-C subfamily serine protease